jgi:biotin synthase
MVREVKALGMETCATLGMLKDGQAEQLKDAGLDYYNHNLDTAPEFYGDIITTREYQDRLDTLNRCACATAICTSAAAASSAWANRAPSARA